MVMQRQRTDSITRALQQWRDGLRLSRREQALLGPELRSLDRQLQRLEQRQLRLAVFGRVGVGKSSLLNALLGRDQFATDVANGCTRRQATAAWERPKPLCEFLPFHLLHSSATEDQYFLLSGRALSQKFRALGSARCMARASSY